MSVPSRGIFISYRRSDSGGYTGRLWDELVARYGKQAVFWDIDTVTPGVPLSERIESALGGCAVLLAVIGPDWLDARGASGSRRLDEPSDYVCREVASALDDARLTVIPVLVEGAAMPARGDLPAELGALSDRAAIELRNRSWSFDLGLLFEALDRLVLEPEPGARRLGAPRRYLRRARQGLASGRTRAWLVGLSACALSVVLTYATGALDGLEHRTMDTRFQIRGAVAPSKDVLIVGADDRTLERYARPQNMPRTVHGRLIDRLSASKPKAIAYDFTFARAGTIGPDNALASAIRRAAVNRRVPVLIAAGPPARAADTGQPELLFLDTFPDSVRGALGAQLGIARLGRDPDSLVVRRLRYADYGKKSFSAIAAELAAEDGTGTVAEVAQRDGWIDYAGPSGTYDHVSFSDVLEGRTPRSRLRGKVVLVGPYTENLPDVHATPVGPMYGVEAEANAIDTMRGRRVLKPASAAITALAVLALGLLPPLIALWRGMGQAAVASLALIAGYLGVVQVAFNHGWVLDVVAPLLACSLALAGALLWRPLGPDPNRDRPGHLAAR